MCQRIRLTWTPITPIKWRQEMILNYSMIHNSLQKSGFRKIILKWTLYLVRYHYFQNYRVSPPYAIGMRMLECTQRGYCKNAHLIKRPFDKTPL